MNGKVYIKLLEAIEALSQELKRTTSDPAQLHEDMQTLYDMVNKYEPTKEEVA